MDIHYAQALRIANARAKHRAQAQLEQDVAHCQLVLISLAQKLAGLRAYQSSAAQQTGELEAGADSCRAPVNSRAQTRPQQSLQQLLFDSDTESEPSTSLRSSSSSSSVARAGLSPVASSPRSPRDSPQRPVVLWPSDEPELPAHSPAQAASLSPTSPLPTSQARAPGWPAGLLGPIAHHRPSTAYAEPRPLQPCQPMASTPFSSAFPSPLEHRAALSLPYAMPSGAYKQGREQAGSAVAASQAAPQGGFLQTPRPVTELSLTMQHHPSTTHVSFDTLPMQHQLPTVSIGHTQTASPAPLAQVTPETATSTASRCQASFAPSPCDTVSCGSGVTLQGTGTDGTGRDAAPCGSHGFTQHDPVGSGNRDVQTVGAQSSGNVTTLTRQASVIGDDEGMGVGSGGQGESWPAYDLRRMGPSSEGFITGQSSSGGIDSSSLGRLERDLSGPGACLLSFGSTTLSTELEIDTWLKSSIT